MNPSRWFAMVGRTICVPTLLVFALSKACAQEDVRPAEVIGTPVPVEVAQDARTIYKSLFVEIYKAINAQYAEHGQIVAADNTANFSPESGECPLMVPKPLAPTTTTGDYWMQRFSAFDFRMPADRKSDQDALMLSQQAHCRDRWKLAPLLAGTIPISFAREIQAEKDRRAAKRKLDEEAYEKAVAEIEAQNKQADQAYQECKKHNNVCAHSGPRSIGPLPPYIPENLELNNRWYVTVSSLYFNPAHTLAMVYFHYQDGGGFKGSARWTVYEKAAGKWVERPWGADITTHD